MVRTVCECDGNLLMFSRLFIIDGVISLPIAIAGFFVLPDVPEISKAFYFSKDVGSWSTSLNYLNCWCWERNWNMERKECSWRAESRESLTPRRKSRKSWLRGIFTLWVYYTCRYKSSQADRTNTNTHVSCFNNGAAGAAPVFAQFLKDSKNPKYTVSQINTYPTGTSAVQVVSTLIYAWFSDSVLNGRRWPPIVFGGVVNIICYVSLAIWDIPTGWKWACYYIYGCGLGLSGLIMAWDPPWTHQLELTDSGIDGGMKFATKIMKKEPLLSLAWMRWHTSCRLGYRSSFGSK